ncbi:MAG: glycosyltransferase family 1 protein [Planctomycetes bacterium]|nr:glycosyltransferase family 1 protein [Planctomycetota bacterium]
MDRDRLKILVLSTFDGKNANVIRDFLLSFNAYSRHRYHYVFNTQILDKETDFSPYDVILIFWSVYLLGEYLSQEAIEGIRNAPALKVQFLQDEYRDVRAMNQAMAKLGIQVMFTCVEESQHEIFYPQALIPSLEGTYSVLTGYVPAYLEKAAPLGMASRALDVGYRSRSVPYFLGDLGREKTLIAHRFQDICWRKGLSYDISVREEDRIYGRAWPRFLRSCRMTLGTGSGASVVDFDGQIRRRCDEYLKAHPDASYAEVKERFFQDVDGQVVIETISPRFFEAAALGCTLVLHEGPYAGLLVPDRHYIPVKKDYSNVEEVVEKIRDSGFCERLAAQTREDLIASGKHSYRKFVERFDAILERHAWRVGRGLGPSKFSFYAHQYFRHQQLLVPVGLDFFRLPSRVAMLVRRFLMPAAQRLAGIFRRPASLLQISPLDCVPFRCFKLLLILRLAWKVASVRWMLARAVLLPSSWRRAYYRDLWRDLLRIALLHSGRACGRAVPGPVRLQPSLSRAERQLVLSAFAGNGKRTADGAPVAAGPGEPNGDRILDWSAIRSDLAAGRVSRIELDYSAVDEFLCYPVSSQKKMALYLDRGRHRFAALETLVRSNPQQAAGVLNCLSEYYRVDGWAHEQDGPEVTSTT